MTVASQFSSLCSVCICFLRSKTIPFYLIIICIYTKYNAKFRHICQFFYRIIIHTSSNRTIRIHRISQCTGRLWCCGHKISKSNTDMIRFFRNNRIMLLLSFTRFVCNVHTCDFPLCISLWHIIPIIIIGRCTPEIRHRYFVNHLFPCISIRYEATIQKRKQNIKIFTLYSQIEPTMNYFQVSILYRRINILRTYLHDFLSIGNFISGFCPVCIFFQSEGNCNCIFSTLLRPLDRKFYFHLRKRTNFYRHNLLTDQLSLFFQCHNTIVIVCTYK